MAIGFDNVYIVFFAKYSFFSTDSNAF